ncbi:hypothetical protein DFJ74DRAFT_32354 [Hyaloraphidium curvatum]|nr:hypothetical protein DFJ74DRAFT_32354 [Hyaloraphidium curvatum]
MAYDDSCSFIMQNHWWFRPGWRPGRKHLEFRISFPSPGGDDVRELAALQRTALDSLRILDLVQDDGLHLTLLGIGFADDMPPESLKRVVRAAGSQLSSWKAFRMELAPAAVGTEGVWLPADPYQAFVDLHAALHAAVLGSLGNAELEAGSFFPHVALAYCNSDGEAEPVRKAVASVQHTGASSLVDHVDIVAVWRSGHLYDHELVDTVPFGQRFDDEGVGPLDGADCLPFSDSQISYGNLSSSAPLALTPPAAIDALLAELDLSASDALVDLGCGSGNILIAAARRGATCVGYEIDPMLVAEAKINVEEAGVKHLVDIWHADLAEADLLNSSATVVYSYLVPKQQRILEPMLLEFLRGLPASVREAVGEVVDPEARRRMVATYEFPLRFPSQAGEAGISTWKHSIFPLYIYKKNGFD